MSNVLSELSAKIALAKHLETKRGEQKLAEAVKLLKQVSPTFGSRNLPGHEHAFPRLADRINDFLRRLEGRANG